MSGLEHPLGLGMSGLEHLWELGMLGLDNSWELGMLSLEHSLGLGMLGLEHPWGQGMSGLEHPLEMGMLGLENPSGHISCVFSLPKFLCLSQPTLEFPSRQAPSGSIRQGTGDNSRPREKSSAGIGENLDSLPAPPGTAAGTKGHCPVLSSPKSGICQSFTDPSWICCGPNIPDGTGAGTALVGSIFTGFELLKFVFLHRTILCLSFPTADCSGFASPLFSCSPAPIILIF